MVCAHGRIGTSSAPAHHATTKPLGTATDPTNIASSTRTATGLRSRQRPQSSNPPPLSEWEGKNVLQLLFASAGLAFGTDIKRPERNPNARKDSASRLKMRRSWKMIVPLEA